ncbi:MAG: dihydroneopterin aldolase [Candidatus Peribacteraceae bacterium]|nr:dihydroneopterin aldolase [Candidatus Peribacteraceae bacterium]MBP9850160.1 dihydroneopterin aldolase [Candidatus Peribacteraceae bacterium]
MDSIFLKDIEVWTRIGVPDSERAKPQRLLVSIELLGSLKDIGTSDDITKGIDYAAVTEAVTKLGATERKTVERFAEDAASLILTNYKPTSVKVTVTKQPDLPLRSASVTVVRP